MGVLSRSQHLSDREWAKSLQTTPTPSSEGSYQPQVEVCLNLMTHSGCVHLENTDVCCGGAAS